MARPRDPRLDWPTASQRDRHGIGVIDAAECWRLLAESSVGRVGLRGTDAPLILPVNFAVVDRRVLFRSERGAKTEAALAREPACFEIDHVDVVEHRGWNVLAEGSLRVVDGTELDQLGTLPLLAWALDDPMHMVCLDVVRISGRVFGHV